MRKVNNITKSNLNFPKIYKGIILAGGSGSRLAPLTKVVSKQLMPVYNKPMIYYPISTLMIADIREFLIITNPQYKDNFISLLGDGSHLGIDIKYKVQKEPKGLAEAFIIGENFIGDHPVALILGDNIFHGDELISKLRKFSSENVGAKVFAYPVRDPERYGVAQLSKNNEVIDIQEKPKIAKSNYAITGLYFYDNSVIEKSKRLGLSERG